MKSYIFKYPIYSSCENLIKVKRHDDRLGNIEYWNGTVNTVHGIVSVESWLTRMMFTDHKKYTFLRFAINGIYYHKTIHHYKKYTCTGLARMAGRFAKECTNEQNLKNEQ